MFDVFNPIALQIHGGGHGSVASAVGEFLAFIESLLSMQPPEIFAAVLPGVAAMGNLHPMFVHFSIAFLLAFFIIDVLGSVLNKPQWRYVAGWMLYLGTASAIITVAAGLHAAATVPHGDDAHTIMERHEHFGLTVLALALALSVWRWIGGVLLHHAANWFYLGLAAFMVLVMTLGADLGGLMVYHHGLNVNAVPLPADVTTHEHNHEGPEHNDLNAGTAPVPADAATPEQTPEQTPVQPHKHSHNHPHVH